MCGNLFANMQLGIRIAIQTVVIRFILHARRFPGAAMKPLQQFLFAKDIDVAPDRLRRHVKLFDKLFGSHREGDAPESRLPAERQAAVGASDAAHRAAQMLRAPTALMQLTENEALAVVGFMRPRVFKSGTEIIRQGETSDTGFMVLVLEGEITVESLIARRVDPATVNVLGPGSLIGEMALVDGAARSASCTASTHVTCAVLTREALETLISEQPTTAAKLMTAVAQRLAERRLDVGQDACAPTLAALRGVQVRAGLPVLGFGFWVKIVSGLIIRFLVENKIDKITYQKKLKSKTKHQN